MSWKESSPGHYQRPLGMVEAPMVSFFSAESPPRESLQIHAIADFCTTSSPEKTIQALKDAWKALRLLKSPDIATSFANGNKYYKVPSPAELEAWQHETCTVSEDGSSTTAAIKGRYERMQWLPQLSIVPHSNSETTFRGTLILFISHWRTEAGGAFKLLNDIFDFTSELLAGRTTATALSSHKLGNEVCLLTPAMEEILQPNPRFSASSIARVKSRLDAYYSRLPTIDFPVQQQQIPPSMKLTQRTYTPTATTKLLKACKSLSISVTAAIHAAYISSIHSFQSDPSKWGLPWTCMMPAEVRKRLPSSSPYRNQGCWNAAQMLLLSVPANQNFLDTAKSLKDQYAVANTSEWLHEDLRETTKQMANPPPGLPPQPPACPWFTSLGVLDKDGISPNYDGVNVSYVTAWADSTGPGIVMRLWTFCDRLNVQIQWGGEWHSDELLKETMDELERVVAKELGVEMEIEEVRLEEY